MNEMEKQLDSNTKSIEYLENKLSLIENENKDLRKLLDHQKDELSQYKQNEIVNNNEWISLKKNL